MAHRPTVIRRLSRIALIAAVRGITTSLSASATNLLFWWIIAR